MARRERNRSASLIQTSQTQVSYSGPLPPASQLEHYERVLPGLADRVVKMAESNASHRQGIERMVIEGNVQAQRRGQWLAFVLSLVIVGAGSWLLILGRTSLGLWLILGDVGAVAAIFVGGKLLQLKERKDRRVELQRPAG